MGSLIKKNDEHPYDFVEKIRYYCSYRSNVLRDKIFETPDRISAMIVHCLPEEPPYIAIKEKFADFYLPGDVPNYYKYKNYYGQWYPDYVYLTNYIVRVERAHYQRLNLPYPNYYYDNPVGNNPPLNQQPESSSSASSGGNQAENGEQQEGDSSMMEISDPNPPPTPIIIDISSDEEEEGEFVQVEPEPESPEPMEDSNDNDFDPSSYKQSTDKRDNVRKD